MTITKVSETSCSSATSSAKAIGLNGNGHVNFATDNLILDYIKNGNYLYDKQIDVLSIDDIVAMQTEFPGTTFTKGANTLVVDTSTNVDVRHQVVPNDLVVIQFFKTLN